MSANDFTAWMARLNLNIGEAATELGIGRNTAARYAKEGADRTIALACAALAHGIPPWGAK